MVSASPDPPLFSLPSPPPSPRPHVNRPTHVPHTSRRRECSILRNKGETHRERNPRERTEREGRRKMGKAQLRGSFAIETEFIYANTVLYTTTISPFAPTLHQTLSKGIADKIKEQCKTAMNVPRYKIMVQVTIGQMKDQGIKITSRCLWDTTTDNYATVSFQNQHIWASAIVFAMYTD